MTLIKKGQAKGTMKGDRRERRARARFRAVVANAGSITIRYDSDGFIILPDDLEKAETEVKHV